ncbi:unnamed protein product [Fraxinus pennsylvanica]|uniref:5MP1/2-like HEAT domain-containing protein n=1 Tax=Fraxinus pennsylvanica TaxID=56036 RepID=A0AAD2A4P4_9LAMI|nr:unnamed protein product [Fraxinus pennsylvanica]
MPLQSLHIDRGAARRTQQKSSKEKPTLGNRGTWIKTRKRNIAAPLDPASFSDAVVQIYLDNAGDLELVARSLESSDLNFSRDGYTFFFESLELFEENERKKLAIFTALAFSQKLSGLPPKTVFQPLPEFKFVQISPFLCGMIH